MRITVKREINTANETVGKLYVDGVFECYTLEDGNRDLNHNGKFDSNEKKVYGDTRIPCGIYRITARTVGRIANWLMKLWPGKVKYSLWIRNIPDFEYVLIHPGTTDKDTLGCLLVGQKYILSKGRYSLVNSRAAYLPLHEKISKILDKNGEVTIEFID